MTEVSYSSSSVPYPPRASSQLNVLDVVYSSLVKKNDSGTHLKEMMAHGNRNRGR